ncbi:hypothetical protein ACJ41O_011006 [Fusarium nematophilum]
MFLAHSSTANHNVWTSLWLADSVGVQTTIDCWHSIMYDITHDMNISGALSIKYGVIGGSGRGGFVNSDKFHESDLNFYISVKLVQPVVAAPIVPLSNRKIEPGSEKNYGPLCSDMHELEKPERHAIKELLRERPDLARYFRLTKPVGSSTEGMQFNTLDFLKHSVTISSVKVGVTDGVVTSIQMQYSNGLQCIHGGTPPNTSIISLDELDERERIIACSIETGREVKPSSPSGKGEGTKTAKSTHGTADPPSDAVELEPRILGMKLFTNRGRSLVAESKVFEDSTSQKIQERGSRKFTDVRMTEFDPVMDNAWIKGFWGYSRNGSRGDEKDGLWRVGVIWGNNLKPEFVPDTEEKDASEGKDKDVSRVKGDKDKKKDKGSKKKEKQDGGR